MDALKGILGTEHGLLGLALILAATTLCALGIMPLERWETYSQVIFATFAGSHAIIAGANAIANRPDATAGLADVINDALKSMTVTPLTKSATVGEIAVAAELKAAKAAVGNPEPPKAG